MLPPTDEWLEIVKYYMFYDVPRLILAQDTQGHFWILDCPFDEESDDYSKVFKVGFAGIDLAAALANIAAWNCCPNDLIEAFVPVVDLQFDPTKRKACMLTRLVKRPHDGRATDAC